MIGKVESTENGQGVARFARKRHRLRHAISWVETNFTNTDGTATMTRNYYIRFADGSSQREATVETGRSAIPLCRADDQPFIIWPNLLLVEGDVPFTKTDLKDTVNILFPEQFYRSTTKPSPGRLKQTVQRSTPTNVMGALDDNKREAFAQLWHKIPAYLHDIKFDFDKALWLPADVIALGERRHHLSAT